MSKKNHIFLYIDGKPISISELGDVADMPICDAFQAIFDRGFMGPDYVGHQWHELMDPSKGFTLLGRPDKDNELLTSLYDKFHIFEEECQTKQEAGTFTATDRKTLESLYMDYKAALKLCED